MLTAIFGVWSLLELMFLLAVVLPLAWATGRDRQGLKSYVWEVVTVLVAGYVLYYLLLAPDGSRRPPVFNVSFWTDANTWWVLGKYLAYGVAFTVVEMLSSIFFEKREIKVRWQRMIAGQPNVIEYVNGDSDEGRDKARESVLVFCKDWNASYRLVNLKLHALDRTPSASISTNALSNNIIPWIVLWPGYLVSLFLGRFLDRFVEACLSVLRGFGTFVLKIVFRNAFKPD